MKQGFSFEFDPPENWAESSSGKTLIFHGPASEELIISGTAITGQGTSAELHSLREQLLGNALSAMKRAIEEEPVCSAEPLRQHRNQFGLDCWRMAVHTSDRTIAFLQATLVSTTGVMLVTLEAPNSPESKRAFDSFIEAVREVSSPTM